MRNAVPRCIQLYNNLTGEKKLKWFERVADQVVTLGLHYVRKLTNEEILVLREKLSPHRQGWTGHLCDLENHRTAGTPGRPAADHTSRSHHLFFPPANLLFHTPVR